MPTVPILRGPGGADGAGRDACANQTSRTPGRSRCSSSASAGRRRQPSGRHHRARELQRQNDDMVQAAMNDAVLARTQHCGPAGRLHDGARL